MSRWEYLDSEAFQLRELIAAELLSGECAEVLEIGADYTGISGTPLAHDFREITLVGPECHGDYDHVVAIECCFQDLEAGFFVPAPDGVAMLGLALEGMTEAAWAHLFDLVNGARRTVIEYPPAHPLPVQQAQRIRANTDTMMTYYFDLDLRTVPVGDPRVEKFGLRRFCVLEPAKPGAENGS